jgi:hypothetical protein
MARKIGGRFSDWTFQGQVHCGQIEPYLTCAQLAGLPGVRARLIYAP